MTKKLVMAVTMLAAGAAWAGEKFELKGDAAKGAELFKTFCTACHGEAGKGDGPAGAALNPKPADFTDPARAAKLTDEMAYKLVNEGGPPYGRSPLMTAWKGPLTDQQIRDVVTHVRSLSKPAGKAAPPAKAPPAKAPPAKK